MTKTYTIAMIGDMLAATALDGDDAMMRDRLNDTLSQISQEDREQAAASVCYITGLELFPTTSDAEDAGATVVYTGCDQGWLQDADGRMVYMAAGRI